MTSGQSEAVLKPLWALIESGSLTGFSDRHLLERFAARRDEMSEAAFSVLVARHGPMVLGVCRHLVEDAHAAEDAFQAVFLVLARRAGSIGRPELLGPWLHGVALRVARKVRARTRRRHGVELGEVAMENLEAFGPGPDDMLLRAEQAAAIHKEIGRLPERYRHAIVLCHFEDLTHAEAARRLGCPNGTVSARLTRARGMLHSRLTRRGLSPGAVLMAAALHRRDVSAAVSPALARATVKKALAFATGHGLAPGIAATLANEALKTKGLVRLTIAALTMSVCGIAASMGTLATVVGKGADPPQVDAKAQDPAPIAKRSPCLPGAVTQPPEWLSNTAPFDVAAFFAAPPPDQNAAPLYLDALFEFGTEVAICFPEGPEREQRKERVELRKKRWPEIEPALNHPGIVSAESIDAVLAEYDEGFLKLARAQERPKCVFQSALGVTAQLPHIQVAGRVARVAALKARRELEQGNINRALHELSRVLKLSRDLRPRGYYISDLVSAAIDLVATRQIILPLLATPALTVQHCDRLLALLTEHESRSIEMYTEGLRAEYLGHVATLRDLVFHQEQLRQAWKSFGVPVGPSVVATVAEPKLVSALRGNGPFPRPSLRERLQNLATRLMSLQNVRDLDARVARTTPGEFTEQVEKLNVYYRSRCALGAAPYVERINKADEPVPELSTPDLLTRVTKGLLPASGSFTRSVARDEGMLHNAMGLAVVRRWQLRHNGTLPPSLADAAKEAGLPAVPLDPYIAQPIRLVIIEGQPVVYCVGEDGRDDQGQKDAIQAPSAGDVLLRLPKP